jgi:hypothetical protein
MLKRVVFAASLAVTTALPAFADSFTSTLIAFDPATLTLVMADRTVWDLPADFILPAGLAEGDTLRITYGAESGVSLIQRLGPDGQPLAATTGG